MGDAPSQAHDDTALGELGEEMSAELEALRYTYEIEVAHPRQAGAPVQLLTPVQPYMGLTSDNTGTMFVQLKLLLTVPQAYPQKLPNVSLLEVKGLGDARQHELLHLLQAEATGLQGSMMLGHLIETANSFLTDNNHPEGACAFCLEPLCAATHRPCDTSDLACLPCFHAFHRSCYCSWWSWQQQEIAQQEQELVKHTGSRANLTVLADKLPPREEKPYSHLFTTNCPVCRTPCPLTSISYLITDLTDALAGQMAGTEDSSSSSSREAGQVINTTGAAQASGVGDDVGVQLAGQLQAMQLRNQRIFKRQQAAGGIISSEAPSYSLSSLAARSSASGAGPMGQAVATDLPVQRDGYTQHSYQHVDRATQPGNSGFHDAHANGSRDAATTASGMQGAGQPVYRQHRPRYQQDRRPDRHAAQWEHPPAGYQEQGLQGVGHEGQARHHAGRGGRGRREAWKFQGTGPAVKEGGSGVGRGYREGRGRGGGEGHRRGGARPAGQQQYGGQSHSGKADAGPAGQG